MTTKDVIVEIDELDDEKNLSDRDLKKACMEYARINFQGKKFLNKDTNREVLVSRDGIGKWYNITKSREQCISIKKLDVILENCVKIENIVDNKNRRSVDGYTYYECSININKKFFMVKIATRETHGRDSKYYYHFLADIKIEPGLTLGLSQCNEER
jgi:hypothetical protein